MFKKVAQINKQISFCTNQTQKTLLNQKDSMNKENSDQKAQRIKEKRFRVKKKPGEQRKNAFESKRLDEQKNQTKKSDK